MADLCTYTNKTIYQRCVRLLLLILLFAVLDLLRDFSFGLGYKLSEWSAISYTGDKRMLHRWTETQESQIIILHKLSG